MKLQWQRADVRIQVDNAKAAIDVLNNDPDIDLLFSDIVMPGMSGLELGRWTRQKLPAIPVMLASGYSEQASAAMREGCAAEQALFVRYP